MAAKRLFQLDFKPRFSYLPPPSGAISCLLNPAGTNGVLRVGGNSGDDGFCQQPMPRVESLRQSGAADPKRPQDLLVPPAGDRYTCYNACRSADWSQGENVGKGRGLESI
jgi:hypothetical protein